MLPLSNFIQQFLDARLFNIADSEERLHKLQASASSLCEEFLQNKSYLIQFMRASLVAKVDEDSVALSKIESHVKQDWPTFRSAQPQRPTAILLAVGWDALRLAVEKSPDLSALIWYAAVNLLAEQANVDPLSLPVIDFVQAQGIEVERRAVEEWNAYTVKVTKSVRAIVIGEVKNVLQQPFLKATSINDPTTSVAIEGGNPHSPSNDGNWGLVFARSASSAVTQAIGAMAKAITDSTQASFDDLNKKVSLISAELIRSHAAQSKRTELLWLSESLYSTRLQKGYRELKTSETILALAFDIAEIATGVAPQSVEFFLAEIVDRVFPAAEIKIETFVRDLMQSPFRTKYPLIVFEPIEGASRISLLEMVGSIAAGQCEMKQLANKTGFAKNRSIPASNLARWIFREIKCREFLCGELWQ